MNQKFLSLLAALVATLTFGPAAAQSAGRQADLAALAEVYGALHHVRRTCAPEREADLWRERMKQLVALEQPTARFRGRLVAAFNEGFRSAQAAYPVCDVAAQSQSAVLAGRGEAIIARLAS